MRATRSTTSTANSFSRFALLRGRELVVEDQRVDVERLRGSAYLLRLALSDVRRGIRCAPALQLGMDRLRRRGIGEQRELDE